MGSIFAIIGIGFIIYTNKKEKTQINMTNVNELWGSNGTGVDNGNKNTLNLNHTVKLSSSSSVKNFNTYNFSPTRANLTNSATPMLTANTIDLDTNAKLEIKTLDGGGTPFVKGDTFTLLEATTSLTGTFEI